MEEQFTAIDSQGLLNKLGFDREKYQETILEGKIPEELLLGPNHPDYLDKK